MRTKLLSTQNAMIICRDRVTELQQGREAQEVADDAGKAEPGITDCADVLAALCERARPAASLRDVHGPHRPRRAFTAPPSARLGNTAGEHGRGLGWLIDTRGHGGYVIPPGSTVDLPGGGTGQYEAVYDRPRPRCRTG